MKTFEQIAAELHGYDPQALRADQVNAFLERMVEPISGSEELPLFQALGRVLAQDIVSPIDVPPHNNSAMDGYAFAGSQLGAQPSSQPLVLRPVGTALAGKAWQGAVGPGECLRIMTGAVLPPGLDTVAPQELVQQVLQEAGARIAIAPGLLQPGDNRRLAGEDLAKGSVALQKGELLTPAALGLAASLGISSVRVVRQLRVAYFSTGDEILSLGEPLREGAVYDSNRYTVFGLLTRMGCVVLDLGVVRDEPAALQAAFEQAAAQADAIITSGGVSVGEADHTKAMMRKLGQGAGSAGEDGGAGSAGNMGGVAFWRIAMRPGRPMAVGRIARVKNAAKPMDTGVYSYENSSNLTNAAAHTAVLFGLPGNPVAVMVTFLAFVRPALLRMMGCRASAQPLLQAHSQEALRKKPGRTEYQRGVVSTAPDGSLQVRTTGNQGSGVLRSMVQANGLIVLHHDQGSVAVGDAVDVLMFDGAI